MSRNYVDFTWDNVFLQLWCKEGIEEGDEFVKIFKQYEGATCTFMRNGGEVNFCIRIIETKNPGCTAEGGWLKSSGFEKDTRLRTPTETILPTKVVSAVFRKVKADAKGKNGLYEIDDLEEEDCIELVCKAVYSHEDTDVINQQPFDAIELVDVYLEDHRFSRLRPYLKGLYVSDLSTLTAEDAEEMVRNEDRFVMRAFTQAYPQLFG